ncbi:MAG: BON domain-containing protein [Hydrogenophaga sp.]|nr:BON domain-containing protein [Hydrogenophaga sp.]
MNSTLRFTALATAIAASALVVACGEREDTTVGQRLDGAVADVQQSGSQLGNDARQAAQDMKVAGSEAADTMARGAADATITAKVNAALAADDQLSALAIDVDTSNGRVELTGTAPNAEARARATTLAQAVEGVVQVDNRLTVEGQG